MNERIDKLESHLTILSKELIEMKELVGSGLTKVGNNFESIKTEIDSLHSKIDILNKKVDNLEGSTNNGFEDVGFKLENLTEEIIKISTVTKYDEQFKNLKGLN